MKQKSWGVFLLDINQLNEKGIKMKIYTGKGDHGETKLGNGKKVEKSSQIIHVLGSIDELNSVIGLVISENVEKDFLSLIQSHLFQLGADISLAKSNPAFAQNIATLENKIDQLQSQLPELTNFILPGGTKPSSLLHLARSVARRTERDTVFLNKIVKLNPEILTYLNRLSDLLFVLSRFYNDKGKSDVVWKIN